MRGKMWYILFEKRKKKLTILTDNLTNFENTEILAAEKTVFRVLSSKTNDVFIDIFDARYNVVYFVQESSRVTITESRAWG